MVNSLRDNFALYMAPELQAMVQTCVMVDQAIVADSIVELQ